MTTDILIVSYAPDAIWLDYCLKAIAKYARGFRQTIVVYPDTDVTVLGPICEKVGNVIQSTFPPGLDGHLDQNIKKSCADTLSDADFFLHVDSDWILTETTTPEDYFTHGRPDLWFEHYSNLQTAHDGRPIPWREITENALKLPVAVETMRHFPILYPRELYEQTRKRIEQMNGKPFEEFVRSAPRLGLAFREYSEFNALGCTAYYLFPWNFNLRHVSTEAEKPAKLKVFWSHLVRHERSRFESEVRPELERIVA